MDYGGGEVLHYFLCPISLQIMSDPVTTITGITYDRHSIEAWLFSDKNRCCPVTNQPIPPDSALVPNHTLRRLIQSWCTLHGVERIPTPRAPVTPSDISVLLADLPSQSLRPKALQVLETLAKESESNRRCMARADVHTHIASLITKCSQANQRDVVEQALRILLLLRPHQNDDNSDDQPMFENYSLVESLTWVMTDSTNREAEAHAILLLKSLFQAASPRLLERLKHDFFKAVVQLIRRHISPQATKAAAVVLLAACPWGSNRAKMVEVGAVTELIEVELTSPEKRTSEAVLRVLDHLCSVAEGRAELVGHAAGVAVVAKRVLRVSAAADEGAVGVLASVCRNGKGGEVAREMLRVGAVAKLCMVLQADCSRSVKEKAARALRQHAGVWGNSPCVAVYLLTRFPRN